MKATRLSTMLIAISALSLFSLSAAGQTPSFLSQETFSLGNNNNTAGGGGYIVSADFNHDGAPDFAVIDRGFSVLLSDGKGGYQVPITYTFKGTSSANSIEVADMNGDGFPDIVIGSDNDGLGASTVQVFLNKGDGKFIFPPVVTTVPNYLTYFAVADFNGDGKPDVAVSLQRSGTVGILLGKGDGTFQPEVNIAVAAAGGEILAGDVNNDGNIDLVLSNTLLLGNGNGTFQPPQTLGLADMGTFALSDVNGDGSLDLVFFERKGLGVVLNQGNGTFGSVINSPTNGEGGNLAFGDFNNDGKIDVALVTGAIMLGNGTGHFQSPAIAYSRFGNEIVAVDANGDGNLDVVGSTSVNNNAAIEIALGNGGGKVKASRIFAAPAPDFIIGQLVMGDFNNDGKLDAAVFQNLVSDTPYASVMLGNGDGTFQPSLPAMQAFGFTDTAGMAAGDFNNDGKLDLVVWNSVSTTGDFPGLVGIFLGNGDGTFQPAQTFNAGYVPVGIALGDFNHDGKLDVAVADGCAALNCQGGTNGEVTILFGNGDGTLQGGGTYPVGVSANSITTADFNKDGNLDLAIANSGTANNGTISVLAGVGDGTFRPALTLTSVTAPTNIQSADINHDGNPDLIVSVHSASFDVLLGAGNGKFGAPIVTASTGDSYTIADFNGDGNPDLAVLGDDTTDASVFSGRGNGHFAPPINLVPGGQAIASGVLGNSTLPSFIVAFQGMSVQLNITK